MFKNNWTLRVKAVESLIYIQWYLKKNDITSKTKGDIKENIEKAIAHFRYKETDPRVWSVFDNPAYIINVHEALQKEWKDEKDKELEELLKETIQHGIEKIQKTESDHYQECIKTMEENQKALAQKIDKQTDLLEKLRQIKIGFPKDILMRYKDVYLNLINNEIESLHAIQEDLTSDSSSEQPNFSSETFDDEKMDKQDIIAVASSRSKVALEIAKLENWKKKIIHDSLTKERELLQFKLHMDNLLKMQAQQAIQHTDTMQFHISKKLEKINKNIEELSKQFKNLATIQSIDEGEINKLHSKSNSYWKSLQNERGGISKKEELDSLYIPLNGSEDPEGGKEFDIEEYINDIFLENQCTCLLIKAKGGSGKSTFVQNLERTMWEKYERNRDSAWIPVYIPLASIDIEDDRCYIFENYLGSKRVDIMLDPNLFIPIQFRKKLLFILDGYDELPANVKKMGIYESNKNCYRGNSKILITSRPEGIEKNINKIFCENKSTDISTIWIRPFIRKKIREYIQKYIDFTIRNNETQSQAWSETDTYMKKIDEIKSLEDIKKLPLFLRLIVEVLPTIKEEIPELRRNELFEHFLAHFFQRKFLDEDVNNKRLARILDGYGSPSNRKRIRKNMIKVAWHFAEKLGDHLKKHEKGIIKVTKKFSKIHQVVLLKNYSTQNVLLLPNKEEKKDDDNHPWSQDSDDETEEEISDWQQIFSIQDSYEFNSKTAKAICQEIIFKKSGDSQKDQERENKYSDFIFSLMPLNQLRFRPDLYQIWHLKLRDYLSNKSAEDAFKK